MGRRLRMAPFLRVKEEGAPYRRFRGIHEWFGDATRGAFSDLRTEIEEIHEDGDRLVVLGRAHYRGRRSGVEVTSNAGWIVEFKDGEIVRVWSFRSHAETLEEAGLDASEIA